MEHSHTLNQFAINKLKININPNTPYQSFTLENQLQQSKEKQVNLIQIQSTIVIREALNYCLKRRAQVFKIWIKNRWIAVNLQSLQGAYSFHSMNYLLFLQVQTNSNQDKTVLLIQQVTSSFKATKVSFKLIVHQEGKPINELLAANQVWIECGSKKPQDTIKLQVASFSLSGINVNKVETFQSSKFQNKLEFFDNKTSSPLGVIQNQAQIYQIFKIQQTSIKNIQSFISKIEPYSSIPFEKENKLFLCHDMKGGYVQDCNFDNNEGKVNKTIFYRSMHLQQSQIFNYFSHYNITIPPKHWRLACKAAKTKCLGTFIIEQPVYSQNTLVSQQFALLLIALAKRCQFDGYLINIETKINSLNAFKKWVGYLTSKIHEYIPNSVIIWYDSISQNDGTIKYQNCLSQQNYEFYSLTDGLFTNYWWNDNLLAKNIQLKGNNPKKVYVGNDCFGRNTYGGGMYNIYKATNKILEFKNDLSIALFAPGYTYEDNGQYNRQLFHLNELSMYKGAKVQVIPIDKWKIVSNKGDGWKKEGDWWVTSYDVCERSALFNFPPLEKGSAINVQFMVSVMGNPVVTESPYKIILQVLDEIGTVLYQNEAYNFNNYKKTPQKEQLFIYETSVDEDLVSNKPYAIKVIEMGKSKVQWAGHYGPRFKDEKLYVLVYQKERHWINKIGVNHVKIGETYHSLCNLGLGDSFFYAGIKMQNKYNYLADFDLPHTHVINHPFDTEINYKNAFIGGTSLTMKKQTLKLLKVYIPKGLNLKKEYFIQITVKDTFNIELVFKYISKNQQERIFTSKAVGVKDSNEWKTFTFKMVTVLNEVKSDIRSIVDIVSPKQPYTLGAIKIIPIEPIQKQPIKCRIQVSRDYIPTNCYYINVILTGSSHRRLLVILQNIANFAYFQDGKASLANISVQKCDRLQFKVVDVDSSLQHITLCQAIIENQDIANLILNGFIDI